MSMAITLGYMNKLIIKSTAISDIQYVKYQHVWCKKAKTKIVVFHAHFDIKISKQLLWLYFIEYFLYEMHTCYLVS